eukprot:gene5714-4077_t
MRRKYEQLHPHTTTCISGVILGKLSGVMSNDANEEYGKTNVHDCLYSSLGSRRQDVFFFFFTLTNMTCVYAEYVPYTRLERSPNRLVTIPTPYKAMNEQERERERENHTVSRKMGGIRKIKEYIYIPEPLLSLGEQLPVQVVTLTFSCFEKEDSRRTIRYPDLCRSEEPLKEFFLSLRASIGLNFLDQLLICSNKTSNTYYLITLFVYYVIYSVDGPDPQTADCQPSHHIFRSKDRSSVFQFHYCFLFTTPTRPTVSARGNAQPPDLQPHALRPANDELLPLRTHTPLFHLAIAPAHPNSRPPANERRQKKKKALLPAPCVSLHQEEHGGLEKQTNKQTSAYCQLPNRNNNNNKKSRNVAALQQLLGVKMENSALAQRRDRSPATLPLSTASSPAAVSSQEEEDTRYTPWSHATAEHRVDADGHERPSASWSSSRPLSQSQTMVQPSFNNSLTGGLRAITNQKTGDINSCTMGSESLGDLPGAGLPNPVIHTALPSPTAQSVHSIADATGRLHRSTEFSQTVTSTDGMLLDGTQQPRRQMMAKPVASTDGAQCNPTTTAGDTTPNAGGTGSGSGHGNFGLGGSTRLDRDAERRYSTADSSPNSHSPPAGSAASSLDAALTMKNLAPFRLPSSPERSMDTSPPMIALTPPAADPTPAPAHTKQPSEPSTGKTTTVSMPPSSSSNTPAATGSPLGQPQPQPPSSSPKAATDGGRCSEADSSLLTLPDSMPSDNGRGPQHAFPQGKNDSNGASGPVTSPPKGTPASLPPALQELPTSPYTGADEMEFLSPVFHSDTSGNPTEKTTNNSPSSTSQSVPSLPRPVGQVSTGAFPTIPKENSATVAPEKEECVTEMASFAPVFCFDEDSKEVIDTRASNTRNSCSPSSPQGRHNNSHGTTELTTGGGISSKKSAVDLLRLAGQSKTSRGAAMGHHFNASATTSGSPSSTGGRLGSPAPATGTQPPGLGAAAPTAANASIGTAITASFTRHATNVTRHSPALAAGPTSAAASHASSSVGLVSPFPESAIHTANASPTGGAAAFFSSAIITAKSVPGSATPLATAPSVSSASIGPTCPHRADPSAGPMPPLTATTAGAARSTPLPAAPATGLSSTSTLGSPLDPISAEATAAASALPGGVSVLSLGPGSSLPAGASGRPALPSPVPSRVSDRLSEVIAQLPALQQATALVFLEGLLSDVSKENAYSSGPLAPGPSVVTDVGDSGNSSPEPSHLLDTSATGDLSGVISNRGKRDDRHALGARLPSLLANVSEYLPPPVPVSTPVEGMATFPQHYSSPAVAEFVQDALSQSVLRNMDVGTDSFQSPTFPHPQSSMGGGTGSASMRSRLVSPTQHPPYPHRRSSNGSHGISSPSGHEVEHGAFPSFPHRDTTGGKQTPSPPTSNTTAKKDSPSQLLNQSQRSFTSPSSAGKDVRQTPPGDPALRGTAAQQMSTHSSQHRDPMDSTNTQTQGSTPFANPSTSTGKSTPVSQYSRHRNVSFHNGKYASDRAPPDSNSPKQWSEVPSSYHSGSKVASPENSSAYGPPAGATEQRRHRPSAPQSGSSSPIFSPLLSPVGRSLGTRSAELPFDVHSLPTMLSNAPPQGPQLSRRVPANTSTGNTSLNSAAASSQADVQNSTSLPAGAGGVITQASTMEHGDTSGGTTHSRSFVGSRHWQSRSHDRVYQRRSSKGSPLNGNGAQAQYSASHPTAQCQPHLPASEPSPNMSLSTSGPHSGTMPARSGMRLPSTLYKGKSRLASTSTPSLVDHSSSVTGEASPGSSNVISNKSFSSTILNPKNATPGTRCPSYQISKLRPTASSEGASGSEDSEDDDAELLDGRSVVIPHSPTAVEEAARSSDDPRVLETEKGELRFLLLHYEPFFHLSVSQLETILERFTRHVYTKNSLVVEEGGEPLRSLILLMNGRLSFESGGKSYGAMTHRLFYGEIEMSYEMERSNMAMRVVSDVATIYALPQEEYNTLVIDERRARHKDVANFVNQIPLFQTLSFHVRQLLVKAFSITRVEEHTALANRGRFVDTMYIIITGKMQMRGKKPDPSAAGNGLTSIGSEKTSPKLKPKDPVALQPGARSSASSTISADGSGLDEVVIEKGPGEMVCEPEFMFKSPAVFDVIALTSLQVAKVSWLQFETTISHPSIHSLKYFISTDSSYAYYQSCPTSEMLNEMTHVTHRQRAMESHRPRRRPRRAGASSTHESANSLIQQSMAGEDQEETAARTTLISAEAAAGMMTSISSPSSLVSDTTDRVEPSSSGEEDTGCPLSDTAARSAQSSPTIFQATNSGGLPTRRNSVYHSASSAVMHRHSLTPTSGGSMIGPSNRHHHRHIGLPDLDGGPISNLGEIIFSGSKNLYRFHADSLDTNGTTLVGVIMDGTILRWNMVMQKITGYTAAEVIGQSIYSFLSNEESRQRMRSALQLSMQYTGAWQQYVKEELSNQSVFSFRQHTGLYTVGIAFCVVPSMCKGTAQVLLLIGRAAQLRSASHYADDVTRWLQSSLAPQLRVCQDCLEVMDKKKWNVTQDEAVRLHAAIDICGYMVQQFIRFSKLNQESFSQALKPLKLPALMRYITKEAWSLVKTTKHSFTSNFERIPPLDVFMEPLKVCEAIKAILLDALRAAQGHILNVALVITIVDPDTPPEADVDVYEGPPHSLRESIASSNYSSHLTPTGHQLILPHVARPLHSPCTTDVVQDSSQLQEEVPIATPGSDAVNGATVTPASSAPSGGEPPKIGSPLMSSSPPAPGAKAATPSLVTILPYSPTTPSSPMRSPAGTMGNLAGSAGGVPTPTLEAKLGVTSPIVYQAMIGNLESLCGVRRIRFEMRDSGTPMMDARSSQQPSSTTTHTPVAQGSDVFGSPGDTPTRSGAPVFPSYKRGQDLKKITPVISELGGMLYGFFSSDLVSNVMRMELPLLLAPGNGGEDGEGDEDDQGQAPVGGGTHTVIVADNNRVQTNTLCQILWARQHAVVPVSSYSELMRQMDSNVGNILMIDPINLTISAEDLEQLRGDNPFDAIIDKAGMGMVMVVMVTDWGDWRVQKLLSVKNVIKLPKTGASAQIHIAIQVAEKQAAEIQEERERFEIIRRTFTSAVPNRHKVVKLLGKGSFGDVFEVEDTLTGGRMAMKEMRLSNNVDADVVLQELLAMTALQHENIIRYFFCEKANNFQLQLYMEIASGGTLKDKIRRVGSGGLPLKDTLATGQPPFSHLEQAQGVGIMRYLTELTSAPDIAPLLTHHPLLYDFVKQCLQLDPTMRPTADQLVEHELFHLSFDKNDNDEVSPTASSTLPAEADGKPLPRPTSSLLPHLLVPSSATLPSASATHTTADPENSDRNLMAPLGVNTTAVPSPSTSLKTTVLPIHSHSTTTATAKDEARSSNSPVKASVTCLFPVEPELQPFKIACSRTGSTSQTTSHVSVPPTSLVQTDSSQSPNPSISHSAAGDNRTATLQSDAIPKPRHEVEGGRLLFIIVIRVIRRLRWVWIRRLSLKEVMTKATPTYKQLLPPDTSLSLPVYNTNVLPSSLFPALYRIRRKVDD